MRPGLVIVGGGLLIVGLMIVAVAILNLPAPNTNTSHSNIVETIPGNDGYFLAVVEAPGQNGGASLTLSWSPTGTIIGYILIDNCQGFIPGGIPPGSCIASGTTGSVSGHVVLGPAPYFPYEVYLVNPSTSAISTSISILAVGQSATGLSLWEVSLIIAAGIILCCMGAVAIFLGYFLKGNPYGRAPTIDEILDEPAPDDGSEKAGDAPEKWDDALPSEKSPEKSVEAPPEKEEST